MSCPKHCTDATSGPSLIRALVSKLHFVSSRTCTSDGSIFELRASGLGVPSYLGITALSAPAQQRDIP